MQFGKITRRQKFRFKGSTKEHGRTSGYENVEGEGGRGSRWFQCLFFILFYLDSGELGGGGVIFTEESVLDTWVSSSSKRKLILRSNF